MELSENNCLADFINYYFKTIEPLPYPLILSLGLNHFITSFIICDIEFNNETKYKMCIQILSKYLKRTITSKIIGKRP